MKNVNGLWLPDSKDKPLSAVMNVLSDTFDRFDIGYIPHRTGSEIIYTAEVA